MTGFESFVGVNPWTALFTFCNMLITFAVLKKFLFKPVKQMIDDRQQEIDTMYADADAAKQKAANLEKGCSWITLFIAMAPSLGFLGTVIGMVMAFEQIQTVGDINPTIVAAGMKVALITTIFGIIVALVLQLFYNYILSKIDRLTAQMEECAIALLDSLMKNKQGAVKQSERC